MKRWQTLLIVLLVGFGLFFVFFRLNINGNKDPSVRDQTLKEASMKLTSSAFADNEQIPAKFTCDGDNINPSLTISDVPAEAKTLALIVDDPDAPVGTWVHWLVWNIDPSNLEISEGSVPPGSQEGTTSFGKPGYGGPCPPSGEHRYFFKLYALDTTVGLDGQATKADLEQAMQGHIIAELQLIGLYSRR